MKPPSPGRARAAATRPAIARPWRSSASANTRRRRGNWRAWAPIWRRKQPQLAAEAFGQAGQAWTSANQPAKALAAQNAGLNLAPDDVDLLVDRAFTQRSLNEFAKALDDLNKAATLDTQRSDILAYRASTYRLLNRLPEARADADAALALDPKNAEALLERGNIRRLADDPAGARADWLQVVELAAGTPAGDAAKANLEKLDVKP